MTTDTKRADLEVITGRQAAILAEAERNNNGSLTAAQRTEFDTLENAYKVLSGCTPTSSGGLRLPRISQADSGMPLDDDPHPPGGQRGKSTDRARATGRGCASLFGVRQTSANGFTSLEDMGRSMLVGDSRKLAALSGQGEGIPSDGGFAIPETFAFEMLDKSLESEIVQPRCQQVGMTSETANITTWDDSTHASGQLFGGLTGQWVEEGGAIDYETAKLRRLKLIARKLGFLTAASNELLSDAPQFEGSFTDRMTAAINWNLDRTFLVTGTGAGQPKSILNDAATITVAKETGQPADTIVYENLCNMFARIHPACLGNSVWVCNQSAIPQLLQLSIAIGTGGSFIPVMTESNGQFKILTRPVVFTEKLNPLGDLGDIMLADFSQYVAGIMRNGMRLDRSGHVKFSTDETVWRIIMRADGQGSWKQAFQPVNGDSLSWAVTLAARA
jgi:HK97 family phage major capsid protein